MKGRLIASSLVFAIIALLASTAIFYFGKKVEVHASTTVLVDHPYQVYFSQPLNSINEKLIYVTNGDGERVEAAITLQDAHHSLSIEHLPPGDYKLHIEAAAFEKKRKAEGQEIQFKVVQELKELTSVEELEDFFQTILDEERKNRGRGRVVVEESADMKTSNAAADTASTEASSSHSSTNNQVEGIEEGDVVVTDGRYIYSIVDQQIVIIDARNPKNLKVANKIKLEGNRNPMQLMLHDGMLIVIADEYIEMKKDGYSNGISMTKAAFYNIKDAENPKLIREVGQDGYMNGIRKYGNTLYIVTNKMPDYWLLTKEKEVELRPYTYDSKQAESIKPMNIDQLTILPGANEPNYTIISAVDLKNFGSSKVETKGYLGGSSALYMSEHALYLTAVNYRAFMGDSVEEATTDMAILPAGATNTEIFKFKIEGQRVDFTASTFIKGSILNQFSMDEHNGYFRVATTEGDFWGSADNASKNHLFVYDENLMKIGEVTDLARGEKIYSARFMGDKAYIVTFKQVDPLFVIDLANPEKPRVLGELKIPGFSNYLHPLGENHLIGIGYDTETRVDESMKQPFVTRAGMKVSLFDITDFANPKEQDSVVIGGRGTYSEIEYNHKALFRHDAYGYYGFPVTVYEAKEKYDVAYKGTGAVVYQITPENGIKIKANLVAPAQKGEQYEDWGALISRLIYIDDTLYTVSRKEIKGYDLESFELVDQVEIK
ncbi:hypothetical protein D1B33_11990 [Lysinibacillus yapensis]|uniref:Uncharacterized protein n=1 Tax=Ureibacillus yapensis TaxID=2304605 RepID=A0A396S5P2_9BACL|nr:beta-propeller domain-containing protein [Lysinibacillus yapensis]RHW35817.1 hypothetical protein D1B33_11990 [Lysinibacillus yapensis]